jgi:hypothetical protein
MGAPSAAAVAWYTRDNYARHRALDPDGLQPTFDEWLRDAKRGIKQLERQGFVVQRVPIEPEALVSWCLARGRKIDPESRASYVFELARAEDTGRH